MSHANHLNSGYGRISETENPPANGCRVFSATMLAGRAKLGEKITAWLDNHPAIRPTDVFVTQSSDEAFHCITITMFFWDEAA